MRSGDRVACVLTNSPSACSTVFGVWLAGASLVSLPTIPRGMEPALYMAQLRRIVELAEPVLITADPEVTGFLEPLGSSVPQRTFNSLHGGPLTEVPAIDPGAEALVQFSSGSTGDPRGCVITAGAIVRQLDLLDKSLEFDPELDHVMSWLPLSHDMGLVGCLLLSYWTGFRLTLGSPRRFMLQPTSWMNDCARVGATTIVAPNFALDLAARVASRAAPFRTPLRRCIVGGERVELATLARASDALGADRLPLDSFVPAYGLAEAVLAVAMTPVGREPNFIKIDGDACNSGCLRVVESGADSQGSTITLVSSGRPLAGVTVRIHGDGEIGEIIVRSPALAEGYLGRPDLTAQRFQGNEFRTGDLGALVDGELYVIGRIDDILIVAGRNVNARDIEANLSAVAGIRPGNCVLVQEDRGRSGIVLLAETHPGADFTAIAREARRISRDTAGVPIDACVFVGAGSLPKTPSGKVQRFRCRELLHVSPARDVY